MYLIGRQFERPGRLYCQEYTFSFEMLNLSHLEDYLIPIVQLSYTATMGKSKPPVRVNKEGNKI